MRLARLDLTRYGHFTDRVLQFPRPEAGAADLHIVYGDNEAGKTTAHNGFLDLLFGIERQSAYGFLHPYATMQVGGVLEIDGRRLELVRIKRDRAGLLDAAGAPLPETVLAGALGGLDRDAFRLAFSLDDETLERGGDEILASRGDLGELLFSASAGLADLSDRLKRLQAEADAFRRPSGRGESALKSARAELDALKARRQALDVQAGAHAEMQRAARAAGSRYAEAATAHAEVVRELEAAKARAAALPLLGDLRDLRAQLAALADLPDAPSDWAEEVDQLRAEEARLAEREATTAAELEAARQAVDDLVVDTAGLALLPRLEALQPQRSACEAAARDLPNRQLELAAVRRRVADLLARLGRPEEEEAAALLLPAAQLARLGDLIAAQSGLTARLETARAEAAAAKRKADDAAAALEVQDGAAAEAPDPALAAILARLRASELSARLAAARTGQTRAAAALEARLGALTPWRGPAPALAAMALPTPEELRSWARAEAEAVRQQELAAIARHQAQAQVARLTDTAPPAVEAAAITEAEAAARRASRERAWAAHRARLDAASADTFETALRADDQATAALTAAALARAEAARQAGDLAEARAALVRAEEDMRAADAHRAEIAARVAAACRRLSPALPEAWGANDLAAWLDRREAALAALAETRSAEAEVAAARLAVGEACAELRAAGVAAPEDMGLPALLDAAQACLEAAEAGRAARGAAAEAETEARHRAAGLAEAEAAVAAWQAQWEEACGATWLGRDADLPTVRAAMEVLGALAQAEAEAASLQDRVGKMARDQQVFAEAVDGLAEDLGIDAGPPLARWQALVDRAGAARDTRRDRRAAEDRLRQAQEARAAWQARTDRLAARRAEICGRLGVDGLAAAAQRLAALAHRAELEARAGETERRLCSGLDVADAASAEAALEGVQAADLAAAQARLESARASGEARLQALYAERQQAADRLAAVGGDAAVASIEAERAALLADLDAQLRRHLRLRFGLRALHGALAAYRERHQSAMLTGAAAAFREISRGAYAGLGSRPGTGPAVGREELIALPATGGSRAVGDLSKGTRFQLYLALRVAGHAELARHQTPAPFVADDILETFDDARAAAAFAALAGMARRGQVIYLTHHRHLCEIARAMVPQVRVQTLDDR